MKTNIVLGYCCINVYLFHYQQQYLSSIPGLYKTSDGKSLRIILGLLKLSDFLMKLKLIMYHDIFKNTDNLFKYYPVIIILIQMNGIGIP